MIRCNINFTNNTVCKAKVSKDISDNQCPKCEYFLCKRHLPRHKCVQHNLLADYKDQNMKNRNTLTEYSEILKKDLQEQEEIESLQDNKKQIFDKIDTQIITNKEKLKHSKFTEIYCPEKSTDKYNFETDNQENSYKKILPLQSMFPGESYQLQQDIVQKLLFALDSPQEKNIMIESPSGTGKTLAILSAVLSFLKKHRETQTSGNKYQIIYASKTMQQLQQVSNEIKKFGYDLRCTIMGSQQEMCVNADIQKQFLTNTKKNKSPQNFGLYCQAACESSECKAFNNSNQKIHKNSDKRPIIDIEEIARQTQNFNSQSTCPYYDSINNIDNQDIILVQHELILYERGIKRLGAIPRRLLIIFDEAHNVFEEACNGSSYRLNIQTLEKVLDYVSQLKTETTNIINGVQKVEQQQFQDQIQQYTMSQIQQMQYNQNNAQINDYNNYYQIQQYPLQLQNLQNNMKEQFQQQQLEKMTNTVETESYPQMIKKLFSREEDEIKLIKLLKSLKFVRDHRQLISTNQSHTQLALLEDVIFFFHSLLLSVREHSRFYKLMAHYSEQDLLNQHEKNMEFIIQCFEPQLSLKRLLKFPNSHFIVTSSTLTPFKSYYKEFSRLNDLKRISFESYINKDHVIQKENFFGRILNIPIQMDVRNNKKWQCERCNSFNLSKKIECKKCHKSIPSWLTFIRKINDSQEKSIVIQEDGHSLLENIGIYLYKLVPVIPGGIILVFHSFNLLYNCIYAWFFGSRYGKKIEKHSKVFFQPGNKQDYVKVIAEYKEHIIKNNKAILFAVAQTDFLDSFEIRDSLSRAVFIIGKPGMTITDGYVEAKMQYLESVQQNNKGNLSKYHWLNDFSIREINQAIGKVIRHKDDYGCVYLIDSDFNKYKWLLDNISEWARGSIQEEPDLYNLVNDTKKFFKQKFGKFTPISMDQMEIQELLQGKKENIKSQYEQVMEFLQMHQLNTNPSNILAIIDDINKNRKCQLKNMKQILAYENYKYLY